MFTRFASKRARVLLLIGWFLCHTFDLYAQDYYVRTHGNDEQVGTSKEAAWKTIDRANQARLGPGDRLLFEGGAVFEGTLEFSQGEDGLPENPIIVGSFGSGHAYIETGQRPGLVAHNIGGLTVRQLTFRGDGRESNGADGIVFNNDLPGDVKLVHIHIEDVEVSGFGRNGISIGSWRGRSGYRDVVITQTISRDNGLNGIFIYAIEPYVHEHVSISGVQVYKNSGHPDVRPNSGSGIILSGVDGGMIEGSIAHDNGWLGTGSVGIWAYASSQITIEYNESFNNRTGGQTDGGGFDLDGGMVDSVMQDNFSHDNDGAGFGLYQYPGASSWERNTIRRNLSLNDGRKNGHAGIQIWNDGSGLRDADIFENIVFIGPSDHSTPVAISFVNQSEGFSVHHNVFIAEQGARLIAASAGQRNLRFFDNGYWPGSASSPIRWGDMTYQTVEAWAASTGQEPLTVWKRLMARLSRGFQVD